MRTKAILILILGAALTLCACARRQVEWVRLDGSAAPPAVVQQALAVCRAEATMRLGKIEGETAMAYVQPLQLPPQPQVPQVDFSPMNGVGESIGNARARESARETLIEGCMAKQGYLVR